MKLLQNEKPQRKRLPQQEIGKEEYENKTT